MKHIPFAALPPAERLAVIAALQRSGLAAARVCVSKLHPDGAPPQAMVSAPGWFRSYEDGEGWIAAMERDLAGRGTAAADAP
ncbi:MAG TPA: hypothetical protein VHL79_24415 [Ramlibacter sp.]|jgi:hypothetical protein|nr:hypothetical protein [Ramlibacter sp.]